MRGDAISFLRETEHLDFATAVETLAARAGITLRYDGEDHTGQAYTSGPPSSAEAMERAVAWYHDRLLGAPDAAEARRYLRESRLRQRHGQAVPPGLGAGGLGRAGPRGRGCRATCWSAPGLAFRNQVGRLNDSFRARVLFPIFDAAGRPVGLGGRVLPGGPGPKYKNTPATPIYDKSRVLYGLNWAKGAIVERGRVVVCEGYTDVIGLHRAGVTEAVATCGTALAEGHVRLLTGFSRRIVLAYDADPAGQGAAEHFYDWERRFDAEISVVALPPGADPADLAKTDPEPLAGSGRRGPAVPRFPPGAALCRRRPAQPRRPGPGRRGQPGPDLPSTPTRWSGPVPDAGVGPLPAQPRAAAVAAPAGGRRASPGRGGRGSRRGLPRGVAVPGPGPACEPAGPAPARARGACAWLSTTPTGWPAALTSHCSVPTWPGRPLPNWLRP